MTPGLDAGPCLARRFKLSVEATGRQWNFFWPGFRAGAHQIRQKLVNYAIALA